MIVDVEVTDPDRYAGYVRLAGPSVEKHGGRYVARGGETRPLEGGWTSTRIVVIEFPSLDQAAAWYDSREYREAREARAGAAAFRMIAVAGT